ncbi:type II secretion system inner membrane protein GspF [Stenotrophomonas sp. MMGLT7]|uniref:type II secretion system inner membrane protein GspF n=1 Tax=Stenotrophomonas sp. MMGLT7 TaxID=2901227 RepID=UPI001E49DB6C|nr:type II secretion system inner membrane protein GspF [Stenotrophomonas sp. MMGLT7]MCD7098944.1 type II secretion system inner membrane protein GspF [Stenotrophomonas sp. MMGLT7]
MAAFEYSALDLQGRTRSGTVAAATLREARALLEGRQLLPLRLEPAMQQERPGLGGRFGARDLSLLTRQLSTLVASAPLEEALRTIGSQSDRRGVRRVVMATHAQVLEGFRLADAMARQGKAFPPLYRAMVAAGESSGALPQILERLAGLLERQQQVRARLIGTLAYPAALALTAVAVVVGLMRFVVPKVVEQFDSMGRELPWLTRAVIFVSDFVNHWGWALLLALAMAGAVFVHLLRRDGFRLRFDRWLLRLPLLGRLLRDLHAARMARTLAIMLDSGLPLIEGLAITARTVGNRVLREATEAMVASIDEGGSLSAAMKRAGVFPPTLLYMAGSGENSGRLAPMLDRAADYLEREIDTFASATLSLLEPAIIVVLGGVVAMIVLSILLPILQFNSMAL